MCFFHLDTATKASLGRGGRSSRGAAPPILLPLTLPPTITRPSSSSAPGTSTNTASGTWRPSSGGATNSYTGEFILIHRWVHTHTPVSSYSYSGECILIQRWVHTHTPVSSYSYSGKCILIQRWVHTHTAVSSYSYTGELVHTHTPVSSYSYTGEFILIHQWVHTHTAVSSYSYSGEWILIHRWVHTHTPVSSYSYTGEFILILLWIHTHTLWVHSHLHEFILILQWVLTLVSSYSYSCSSYSGEFRQLAFGSYSCFCLYCNSWPLGAANFVPSELWISTYFL